jgi:hypothetical protein
MVINERLNVADAGWAEDEKPMTKRRKRKGE